MGKSSRHIFDSDSDVNDDSSPERTALSLDTLVTAYVLIVVTVYLIGLVFPLEGPFPTLSRDIWTVHAFPIVVHVPLDQVARCKGL
jgi:hypothetical protein